MITTTQQPEAEMAARVEAYLLRTGALKLYPELRLACGLIPDLIAVMDSGHKWVVSCKKHLEADAIEQARQLSGMGHKNYVAVTHARWPDEGWVETVARPKVARHHLGLYVVCGELVDLAYPAGLNQHADTREIDQAIRDYDAGSRLVKGTAGSVNDRYSHDRELAERIDSLADDTEIYGQMRLSVLVKVLRQKFGDDVTVTQIKRIAKSGRLKRAVYRWSAISFTKEGHP